MCICFKVFLVGEFLYMCVRVCVWCFSVFFQNISTRDVCVCVCDVSGCFYQRDVLILYFRLFLPGHCGCFVSEWIYQGFWIRGWFQNVCTRAVWVFCISECFYQRSECGCFVFQNVSTRVKCIRVGPSSGQTPAPPVRVRRGRCSVAPRTAPLPTAPSRSHPPWPAVQPVTWVRVVSTSAPQAVTVFIRLV